MTSRDSQALLLELEGGGAKRGTSRGSGQGLGLSAQSRKACSFKVRVTGCLVATKVQRFGWGKYTTPSQTD